MSRLEIEITTTGIKGVTKDVSVLSQRLAGLGAQYRELLFDIGAMSREQMAVGKAIRDINAAYNQGLITQKEFTSQLGRLTAEYEELGQTITQAQSRVSSLKATMDQLGNSTRTTGEATGKLQAYADDFTKGINASNAVAVEFSRVIQDLPYGMQGIANNLQQLSQNWAYYVKAANAAAAAQGQTVTKMQLVRGALSSMLTPVNLLTLGISAATAAWVAYEKWQQKANKSKKEAIDLIDIYVAKLSEESKIRLEGQKAAGDELAKMNTLMTVLRDVTSSVGSRTAALGELQAMYPKVFNNFDIETIKTMDAAEAYRALTASIIAKARASAAEKKIEEKSDLEFAIDERIKAAKEELKILKEREKLQKKQGAEIKGEVSRNMTREEAELTLRTGDALTRSLKLKTEIADKQQEITAEQEQQKKIQDEIAKLSEIAANYYKSADHSLLGSVTKSKAVKDNMEAYVEAMNKLREMNQDLDVPLAPDGQRGYEEIRKKYRKAMVEAGEVLNKALKVKPEDADAIQEYFNLTTKIALARTKELNDHRKELELKNAKETSEIELVYERKANQSIVQTLVKRLNDQYKAEVAHLNKVNKEKKKSEAEVLEEQAKLQERYWADLTKIDQIDAITKVGFLALKDAIKEADSAFDDFIKNLKNDGKTSADEITRMEDKWKDFKTAVKEGAVIDFAVGLESAVKDIENIVNAFSELGDGFGKMVSAIGDAAIKLNKMIGQAIASAGRGLAEGSGGNPIVAIVGAVLSVVGSVWQIIDQARAKRKQNHEEQIRQTEEFYRNQEEGERRYQAMLRERRFNEAYGDGGYKGVKSAMAVANENIRETQKAYDSLFENVRNSTYLAGREMVKLTYNTTKFHKIFTMIDPLWGAITSGAKRTKTEFRNMYKVLTGAEYDELEELYEKGQLSWVDADGKVNDQAERDFLELRRLREEILATGKSLEQLEDELDQMMTGTTLQSLAAGFVDLFAQGKTSAKDFADYTEQVIKNAMVSSFIAKYAMDYMEPFFKELSSQMDTGEFDLPYLLGLAEQGYNKIGSGLEVLEKALGIKLFDPLAAAGRQSAAGAIGRAITEESASRIEGIWRGVYELTSNLVSIQGQALNYLGSVTGGFSKEQVVVHIELLAEIAANTLRTADNTDTLVPMLQTMEGIAVDINVLATNSKEKSERDLGI